ncbi:sulfotransferase [Marimonas arenosa]|uniref:Sulfotransferase n=1 Tax=Marimonas arenosa TaxID=1795305 RepID=A0AAE3WGZ6_9RHOB|nr:sulfotransferase [Marimonas arenosa]MDQ2091622.1 sulfotransferase [Marimonas arenosa]
MADRTVTLRRYPELEGKTFLICVGAAKCGTSWLHHYLGALPGVVVSPLKELHFFNARFAGNALGDTDAFALSRLAFHLDQTGEAVANLRQRPTFQASVDRVQMIYDDNAYFGHFSRLCTGRTRCLCDITPAYSVIGPEGFAYMKAFCASQGVRLRILFLMRDPVDRYWSQLRHLQQMNPANDIANTWPKALDSAALTARADYRGVVSALDQIFPSADLLYLFYETLFDAAALHRLCAFAGASFSPGKPTEPRNETTVKLPLPEAARDALTRRLAPQYAFCRERFGDAVPKLWSG